MLRTLLSDTPRRAVASRFARPSAQLLACRLQHNGSRPNNGKDKKDRDDRDDQNKENDYKSLGEYLKSKQFAKTLYLTVGFTFLFHVLTSPASDSPEGPVLTFQEFKTKYLEKGLVKKIYVVNKHIVEAELLPQAAGSALGTGNGFFSLPNSSSSAIVAFTIGSVDAFEEQIDQLQDKLASNSA